MGRLNILLLRQPLVTTLLGVVIAFGGLLVELFALPLARFGHPLIPYTAENVPQYESVLTGSLIVWGVAAIVPVFVALLVSVATRWRRGNPWIWALFGFGLPSLSASGVAFVIGGVTYNTGVIPDPANDGPWLLLAQAGVFGGGLALLVALVLAVKRAGERRSASTNNVAAETLKAH